VAFSLPALRRASRRPVGPSRNRDRMDGPEEITSPDYTMKASAVAIAISGPLR
jgi:hypothetical protein